MPALLNLLIAGIAVFFITLFAFIRRYKRCPSDKILVVYGKISGGGEGGLSAQCYHGGAAFIWPVVQAHRFLDLTPMAIEIKLEGALSKQNIRVNTPATFTVGISTEPGVMENAAERLLELSMAQVSELARDIIFGQMRVVIATRMRWSRSASAAPISPSRSCSATFTLASLIARAAASLPRASM